MSYCPRDKSACYAVSARSQGLRRLASAPCPWIITETHADLIKKLEIYGDNPTDGLAGSPPPQKKSIST